jgi:uncharacterized protein
MLGDLPLYGVLRSSQVGRSPKFAFLTAPVVRRQASPSGIMLMVERVDPLRDKRVGKEKLVMSEQENTQLVQQEYRDFQNGDIRSVLGSLSSDVEWVVPQPKGVPLGGTYHGVEEVGRFFSSLGDTQEARQFEPREFVAQGDRVVALGHYAWHVKSTGREWESDFAHVFTVHDGKVTRFQEYTDSAALAEAFGEG